MALIDVKKYYYTMQAQYLAMKADLADFDQAFKDGYITEDKLEAAKEDIRAVEVNYQRLSYIMYLLAIPRRARRKPRFNKENKKVAEKFTTLEADEQSVKLENSDALEHFKAELKKLTKDN